MSTQFMLTILTPDKEFWRAPVEQLIFETPGGRLGVMGGHEPMVAAIAEGTMEIQIAGEWKTAATGQGFAEVSPQEAEIFVDTAEWAEDIDTVRANQALKRADMRMKSKLDHMEYLRTQAAMARAAARLKAVQTKSRKHD